VHARGSILTTPILKDPSELERIKLGVSKLAIIDQNVLLNYYRESCHWVRFLFGIMVSMWIVIITVVYL